MAASDSSCPTRIFKMVIVWLWMLALGLLLEHGEAQSCTQEFGGPNLARGRRTAQSSTELHSNAGRSSGAVDGKCDAQWESLSCTHTKLEKSPWWSVDLGREYAIAIVVVKNRADEVGHRIQGATVHVGHRMGDFGATSFTCGTITDIRDGSLTTIHCNGVLGRYITIVIPDKEAYLTLCEVEVYGTNPPFSY